MSLFKIKLGYTVFYWILIRPLTAFDPHSLLLHRLKLLGIDGSFLSWLSDFFSGRFQYISVGDHLNSSTSVQVVLSKALA